MAVVGVLLGHEVVHRAGGGPPPAAGGELRERGCTVDEAGLPLRLADRGVGRRVLGGGPAVDLAGGRVADLVVLGPRVGTFVRRVGARGHRLGLDRRGAPGGGHLQRHHAAQVVLQAQPVDRVAGLTARRGGGRAELAAVGPLDTAGQHQGDRLVLGVELALALQDEELPPAAGVLGAAGQVGDLRPALAVLADPPGLRPDVVGQHGALAGAEVGEPQPRPGTDDQVVGGVGADEHADPAGGAAGLGARVVERQDLFGTEALARRALGTVLRHAVAVPEAPALDPQGRLALHVPPVRGRGGRRRDRDQGRGERQGEGADEHRRTPVTAGARGVVGAGVTTPAPHRTMRHTGRQWPRENYRSVVLNIVLGSPSRLRKVSPLTVLEPSLPVTVTRTTRPPKAPRPSRSTTSIDS